MYKSTILFLLGFSFTLSVILSFGNTVSADENKSIQYYHSGKILPANLPFSELVRVGNTLYLSGQLGVIPGTLNLVSGGIKEQAAQTMENIKLVLEAHNYSMKNVVKCTVMLADISEWGTFNKIYESFFSKPYPARSAFGANGLGLGAKVEVECIGAVKS